MSSKYDPAFPVDTSIYINNKTCVGLSKREYIATQIAAGLASKFSEFESTVELSEFSVMIADNLLIQLDK